MELPLPGYPYQDQLRSRIEQEILQQNPTLPGVHVNFQLNVKGPQSGGAVGLRVKNVIAVGSGKGGVGKSTISTCLAYGLSALGAKVGLLDADVYGPSIPLLTGASGKPEVREHRNPNGAIIQRIHPVSHNGLAIMSIGFLVPEQEAIIWRGPMLPLSQMMSLAGAVVVCTPQKVALLDAVKAIGMYEKVNIPILGLVENMSGELFGRGGVVAAAQARGLPFLGEVPTDAAIRIMGDDSQLQQLFSEENPSREILLKLATNLAMQTARQYLSKPQAPTLEILQ